MAVSEEWNVRSWMDDSSATDLIPSSSFSLRTRGTVRTNNPRLKFWQDDYARLKDDFVNEMRQLSKLRHPCIAMVMGAVICKCDEPLLVMEYMDHGSLYDLLHKETMPLDGEFILPILRHITQGVRFLHAADPQVVHGDLKSQNILVDGKFRAKDFGLSIKSMGAPFWMAPELLRGESLTSTETDSYSFGMILSEVYSREHPYYGEDKNDMIRQVADPVANKRPPVPESCPGEIKTLMARCLDASPGNRPSFEELDVALRELNVANVEPGETTMTSKVKKYNKTNSLLREVFPPYIANALMEGQKVQPESHSIVTIFFSDIVGFTTLSSRMAPIKVSDMIDRLYLKFDALSRQRGVFKLEAVGDA